LFLNLLLHLLLVRLPSHPTIIFVNDIVQSDLFVEKSDQITTGQVSVEYVANKYLVKPGNKFSFNETPSPVKKKMAPVYHQQCADENA